MIEWEKDKWSFSSDHNFPTDKKKVTETIFENFLKIVFRDDDCDDSIERQNENQSFEL